MTKRRIKDSKSNKVLIIEVDFENEKTYDKFILDASKEDSLKLNKADLAAIKNLIVEVLDEKLEEKLAPIRRDIKRNYDLIRKYHPE